MRMSKGWMVGLAAGAAVGAVAMSMTNNRARSAVRAKANQAISAVSDLAEDVGDLLRR